jgi:predicted ATP-dependent Lon-type protease
MERDFLDREVVEIQFTDSDPDVLGLKMRDYFGDGSFYLVDAPGVSYCSLVFLVC